MKTRCCIGRLCYCEYQNLCIYTFIVEFFLSVHLLKDHVKERLQQISDKYFLLLTFTIKVKKYQCK